VVAVVFMAVVVLVVIALALGLVAQIPQQNHHLFLQQEQVTQ
jgi:hypothetical protein